MSNDSHRIPLRVDRKTRYVFCDESCVGKSHRYFVLGALHYEMSIEDVEVELRSIKEQYSLYGEIKWDKVPSKPGKYFDGYKAIIKAYSTLPINYKAIIIDTSQYPLNHPIHAEGRYDIGYFKFYFQLLFNGVMTNKKTNYQIWIDHPPQSPKKGIANLESIINLEAHKNNFDFPESSESKCCNIQGENSKNKNSLQLSDLLTGIISSSWNHSVKNETKLSLTNYFQILIKHKLSKPSLGRHLDKKCNRWLFCSKR